MINRRQNILHDHPSTLAKIQSILYYLIPSIVLLFLLATNNKVFDIHHRLLLITTLLLMIVIYSKSRVTHSSKYLYSDLSKLALNWFLVVQLLAVVGFLLKVSGAFSREIILLWVFSSFILQALTFLAARLFFYRDNITPKAAIIIGASKIANYLEENINSHILIDHKIIGYLNTEPSANMKTQYMGNHLENLSAFVARHNIQVVYIALPLTELNQLNTIYLELLNSNIKILWAPDIFDLQLINHNVKEIAGAPILSLSDPPEYTLEKVLMDKIASLIGIIVTAPITLPVALIIKLTSPGPILFKQERHGWNNQIFYIYKFRSMQMHEEEGTVTQAKKDDARFTAIGRWIRKYSIDELPQLLNVFQGHMSLVGPRPHAVAHNTFYEEKINYYLCRHKVKPGITGLAQVSGCRGETDTLEKMEKRIMFDLYYINNWSIFLDIKIILMTAVTMLKGEAH